MRQQQLHQIFMVVALPTILSLGLLFFLLRGTLHDWAIERWSSDQYAFVQSLAHDIDEDIKHAAELLGVAAASDAFAALPEREHIDLSINGIPEHLDGGKRRAMEYLRSNGGFSVVFVLTPEGDHYISHPFAVQRSLNKYNLSDRPYFQQAKTTRTLAISDSFIGADGVPAVAINFPVLDVHGEIVMHLGGVLHLKHLSDFLAAKKIKPFDFAVIRDHKKQRIAASDANRLAQPPAEPLLSYFRTQSNIVRTPAPASSEYNIHTTRFSDGSGEQWFAFGATLDSGWDLDLFRRESAVESVIAPQIRQITIFTAAIVVLTGVIGLGVANRFYKKWIGALKNLQESHEMLERQVAERTRELHTERDIAQRYLDIAGSMLLALDRDGRIAMINQAGERLLGASAIDLVGRDWFANFIPASEQQTIRKVFDQHMAGDISLTEQYENAIVTTTGTSRLLAWHNVLLRDANGRITGVLASAEDITERHREMTRNATILRTALDGFWLISADGQLCDVNAQAGEMLGYSRDELLALHINDIDVIDDPEVIAARVREIQATGGIQFESKHRRKDGCIIDVEISTRKLPGEELIAVFVRDITARKHAEDGERLLGEMIRCSDEGFNVVKRADGTILYTNPRFDAMFGYAEGELKGQPVTILNAGTPEQARDVARMISDSVDCSGQWQGELLNRRKDGTEFWTWAGVIRIDHHPEHGQLFVTHQADISERKKAENRLQQAAQVFSHSHEGIIIADPDARIAEVNEAFTRITGYSREEALGKNPSFLSSGRQTSGFYELMWQSLMESGHWSGEIWNRRKSGELYAEMLTISAVRDAVGNTQNYVAQFTDITSMKNHQRQLEHIAHYDALTNLGNRVLLADRLQQAMAQCQRRGHLLAVAYLDLDGFKPINDNYGHAVGDELLIKLAQRLNVVLREGDTLARIGGDEFVAVLVDLQQAQDCEPVLARLLRAAAGPVAVGGKIVTVSASIGVTLYPRDGDEADQLMRHADQAMYQAKLAGKNRYHIFDVAQDNAAQSKRESLDHIRCALKKNQFVLFYQPKVNLKSGKVVGAEALVRWLHPERGLLPPATFLPIIENHELSVELGEWVIDTALAQMSAWRAAGLTIEVSVNVGAYQLQEGDFVGRLSTALAKYPDIPPDQLELEVLETSALDDVATVRELMNASLELGVNFALDDFGTGYSSLNYLRRLPARTLKIDQSFVRDMLIDPDDMAIVQGVIGLAQSFQRAVIAEGVETAAHGSKLLTLGCELAQGYGIARPMPAADLPPWVQCWQDRAEWTA